MALEEHKREPAGVLRMARRLRKGHAVRCSSICGIVKGNGLVAPSVAKSGKRKWIRYEGRHSNSMWHTGWHIMKDPRFRGPNLITFLDGASRCVTGAVLFTEATSENAVAVLRQAIERFGTPATILSDNGSCFVGVLRKEPKKSWQPTAFESEPLDRGIELINSGPYRPQTSGKLERFHRGIGEEIFHYEGLPRYIEYCNERRLHFSLDTDNYETPLKAFFTKKATEAIRKKDPKRMEADSGD